MNVYPQLADAAWLRLVIVGLDILAVVVTVRVCSVLTAWWRTRRVPQPVPATVRPHVRAPLGRPPGPSLRRGGAPG